MTLPSANVVLAVDLGGTKTSLARVDEQGTIRDHRKIPAARTLDETVEQIAAAALDVTAIGVIVPGIYSPQTGRAWCPNLWGDEDVPLRDALADRLPLNVAIESDRTGYLLGETWLGAARGRRDVVFVSIGTGIGVGIMTNGLLVRGAHGIAGAAGWFALGAEWNEIYRATGCWEGEAAGPAVARHAGVRDAEAAVAAARSGDESAQRTLLRSARYTGMGIANVISLLNPEVVVLGGGLLQGAGDLVLEPIRAEVMRWAQPIAAKRCRIELTQLGDRAGVLGAARLALDARPPHRELSS